VPDPLLRCGERRHLHSQLLRFLGQQHKDTYSLNQSSLSTFLVWGNKNMLSMSECFHYSENPCLDAETPQKRRPPTVTTTPYDLLLLALFISMSSCSLIVAHRFTIKTLITFPKFYAIVSALTIPNNQTSVYLEPTARIHRRWSFSASKSFIKYIPYMNLVSKMRSVLSFWLEVTPEEL
jgi:hypothetical protein